MEELCTSDLFTILKIRSPISLIRIQNRKMKKNILSINTALIFSLVLLSSCNSSQNKVENLEKENALKQSEIQQQKEQIDKLEKRLSALEQTEYPSNDDKYSPPSNNNSFGNKQYYFVVLKVVEDHYPNKESFFYTTSVNEISNYDEAIKYQLLDKVVSNYKSSPSGMVYKGNVKDRQIYLFNNYAEASKAREKYIMN